MSVTQLADWRGIRWTRLESRTWRRRLIVATYSAYVALFAEILVHEHFGRPWPSGLRTPATLLFGLTALVAVLSWAWMLSAAVRYGFGPAPRRLSGIAQLRALKARGYSARETLAAAPTPPDERQQSVRSRAQAVAFQISTVIVMAGAIYTVLATQFVPGLWFPHSAEEIWVIVAVLAVLYSTLPSAILGWTEPDPPAEIMAEVGSPSG